MSRGLLFYQTQCRSNVCCIVRLSFGVELRHAVNAWVMFYSPGGGRREDGHNDTSDSVDREREKERRLFVITDDARHCSLVSQSGRPSIPPCATVNIVLLSASSLLSLLLRVVTSVVVVAAACCRVSCRRCSSTESQETKTNTARRTRKGNVARSVSTACVVVFVYRGVDLLLARYQIRPRQTFPLSPLHARTGRVKVYFLSHHLCFIVRRIPFPLAQRVSSYCLLSFQAL